MYGPCQWPDCDRAATHLVVYREAGRSKDYTCSEHAQKAGETATAAVSRLDNTISGP